MIKIQCNLIPLMLLERTGCCPPTRHRSRLESKKQSEILYSLRGTWGVTLICSGHHEVANRLDNLHLNFNIEGFSTCAFACCTSDTRNFAINYKIAQYRERAVIPTATLHGIHRLVRVKSLWHGTVKLSNLFWYGNLKCKSGTLQEVNYTLVRFKLTHMWGEFQSFFCYLTTWESVMMVLRV